MFEYESILILNIYLNQNKIVFEKSYNFVFRIKNMNL